MMMMVFFLTSNLLVDRELVCVFREVTDAAKLYCIECRHTQTMRASKSNNVSLSFSCSLSLFVALSIVVFAVVVVVCVAVFSLRTDSPHRSIVAI